VPPHVFALDAHHLRYGGFTRSQSGLSFDTYRITPLPPGTFAEGPLGGPMRYVAAFTQVVREFVEPLGPAARRATLVLPDSWLRTVFAETEELPAKAPQREEVVRFKLDRLVPFRVEDLRVSFEEVKPLAGQALPSRIFVGFAIELLVAQLEEVFAGAGVSLGQITNGTMAALCGFDVRLDASALAALVVVDREAYTISFLTGGAPLLYRYKALGAMPEKARGDIVRRDLRLTRSFIETHVAELSLDHVVLALAPEQAQVPWQGWLEDALAVEVEAMAPQHLPLADGSIDLPWQEIALMVGAAASEVA